MSYAEQRHISKQKQNQNEAMPGEEPEQNMVPFVYLTSPLFLNTAPLIEMEVRKQLLCGLRQKILAINKKRPQFVIVNSFHLSDKETRKLLGKISETISVILNDGEECKGFSIFPLYGSLVQGIILHLEINSSGTPFIDEQTLNYVKGEMESNSVSGTATFVAVNLDPRKLPSKVLRRLLTRKYSIRYWTK